MSAIPAAVESLVDILRLQARRTPDRRAYAFLADGEVEQDSLTYGELELRTRIIGARLMQSCRRGETALLLYPPGLEFIAAFFACLAAGVVAVPAYPPRQRRIPQRLLSILADARPRAVLTSSALLPRLSELSSHLVGFGNTPLIATDALPDEGASGWEDPRPRADETAFLQYTSGSTSTPKGVMVSHANLVHNMRVIEAACGQSSESVFVSWLPVYHDMGLIGNVLHPLSVGAPCVLMAPVAFFQRPLRWLRAVSNYGATISGGPNFAYELCVRQIDEAARADLDLTSWSVAFNGAEPVQAETLDRFFAAFAGCGLRREVLYPCYGLAEATLFVTGGRQGEPARVLAVDGSALEQGRIAPVHAGEAPDSRLPRLLVGCGRPQLEQEVAIVDPATGARCLPGQVGEIWVAGGSVAQGYWGREPETRAVFGASLEGKGPYLRTGDLGAVEGGDLFVTGRLKDLIIIRGRNLYPQDIEVLAESSHPALRAGCGGAFTISAGGEERLVVVQEIERRREEEAAEAAAAIRRDVAAELDVQLHEVLVVRAGSVPKTSSGKIQRHACREGYLAGTFTVVAADAPAAAPAPPVLPAPSVAELASLSGENRAAALLGYLIRTAAQVARVEPARVDPAAPLSHLGFDSLMAVELQHQVEAELGGELSLAAVLESPSLLDLAAQLSACLGAEQAAGRGASAAEAEIPLSWGQRGLWFLERLAPEGAVFNLAAAARIEQEVDTTALDGAVRSLALRHPALRTTFHAVEGEPVQRVGDGRGIELRVEAMPAGQDGEGLAARLAVETHRPFDLERGPLFRATLFTGPAERAVLLLAAHHLVADFWSLEIAVRDLGALYEQELSGVPAALPPVRASYADQVHGERDRLSRRGEELWSFWREELGGNLPDLDLPTDRPRPPVQTHRGAVRSLRLGDGWAGRIGAVGRERGATVFMTLLAAFEVLLSRYSGQQDLLVGSPVAGRASAELAEVVGYFVNPVVIRADLDGDPSLAELLERVRRRVLAALEHRDYPFPLLVERLAPVRDPSRSPLFQAMFLLHRARRPEDEALAAFALGQEGGAFQSGPLRLAPVEIAEPRSQVDLSLSVAQVGDEIAATLLFNADLFDGSTARRMLGHWEAILEALAEEPGQRLSQVSLLGPVQRQQVILEWNDTGVELPADPAIHHLFLRQARLRPEAPALWFGSEVVDYGELDRRSAGLARRLRRLGVGPEVRVGLCLERSVALVAGLLGVLRSGGAYVPLDPLHPEKRLAWVLEDSGATVLLTQRAHRDRFPGFTGAVVLVDNDGEADGGDADEAAPAVSGDSLAYVIYTSGSTGRPKGVQVTHRGVVNFLTAMMELGSLGPGDTLLSVTTVSFDIAVLEIFLPLAVGGRIALADGETASDGRLLAAALDRSEATAMQGTPASWRLLLAAGWEGRPGLKGFCGGEALPRELALQLLARTGSLWNLYGPTETTVWSTVQPMSADAGQVLVGRPIANTTVAIVDPGAGLAPPGVVGELAIGGAGVARGYLGRPDLTAERFVPDPWGEPGARFYRTGDLARRLPDGRIELLGRIDHQVKVRGFRIELGEIESALAAHPGVAACAVLARQTEGGERTLAAYVVPAGPAAPATEELRRFLGSALPAYMVPSSVTFLSSLPLTPSGKVDRRALSGLAGPVEEAESDFGAPATPAEELLAGIWAEVLGRQRIGARSHFFDLGGHSLLAAQIVSRVRDLFGVELPLRVVFEEPTLAGLALRIASHGGSAGVPAITPLGSLEGPLSFAQQRLWFLAQLEPDSPSYNLAGALRLTGDLDPAALAFACGEIVRRHSVLRTAFPAVLGSPRQRVGPAVPAALPVVDLSGLPERLRGEAVLRLAADEAERPFRLEDGPVLRMTLLREEAGRHVFLITLHHIAGDRWSLSILLRELAAHLEACDVGAPPLLPELAVQYLDFATWQRSWLAGEVLEREIAFWRAEIDGAPTVLELPLDRSRPAVQTFRGATLCRPLADGAATGLTALARRQGVTLFMALLAGFQGLLHRYSGQPDLLVGCPISNRGRSELEPLVGLFVNTIVLRSTTSEPASFRRLLEAVRGRALAAYAHQDLPLDLLIDALALPRDLSLSPLVQVMFTLENGPLVPATLAGLAMERIESVDLTSKFDLDLTFELGDSGLTAVLAYSTDLFDAASMARLLGHLEVLTTAALTEPERELWSLPLLTDAERHQALVESAGPHRELPEGLCVHHLFERWAEREPQAVAVVDRERRWTYGELNARANRLAARLIERGIGPEGRVVVYMERCLETVLAVLAVLKAGGAYVPVDTAHSRTRLQAVLAGSGARLALTLESFSPDLAGLGIEALPIDEGWDRGLPFAANPVSGVSGENLAYLIYTSGSTGQPKGVMIRHRGLLTAYLAWEESYHLRSDCHLQMASFSFDVFAGDLVRGLCSGGRLVLCPPELLLAPADLYALMRREGVNCAEFVPAVIRSLAAHIVETGANLAFLRLLVVGSDAWYGHELAALRRLGGPGTRLINSYGVSESTIDTSYFEDGGGTLPADGLVPIGQPFANSQMLVLGSRQELVPLGHPGELCIAGSCLARGYLGNPALTAEKFVPHPCGPAGERAYRTGDLARRRLDGGVDLLGRMDHQVKVRGFRVELGEIEAVLGQHPGVSGVVVKQVKLGGVDKLVAYTTSEPHLAPETSALRAFLKERVPEFLIPAAFVRLAAFPLNRSGKIDRKALPLPEEKEPGAQLTLPRTAAEKTLAAIWSEVLRVSAVGIDDNFFELGGDSILSIQVIARAAAAGLRLTPRQLFQHQTVAELAAVAGAAPAAVPARDPATGPMPLTPIQRWFFAEDFADPHHWNQTLLLAIPQDADPAALAAALTAAVEHHEALSLRFWRDENGWRQAATVPPPAVRVPCYDLSALPAGRREAALEQAGAAMQASLDLGGPLLRAACFRLGERARLLLVLHHLVVDGVSWRILLQDLATAYAQVRSGEPVRLPPRTSSFKEWAERLAEHAGSAELASELGFWRSALELPVSPLPVDFPRRNLPAREGSARTVVVELDAGVTRPLLTTAHQAYRTQVNDLLLTALALSLAEWTGQRTALVDLEGHGREDLFPGIDLSRTVGWFTTVFPVAIGVPKGGYGEALKAVKERLREIPRRGIGFGLLRYLAGGEAEAAMAVLPRAELSFNYLGQADAAMRGDGFGLAPEAAGPSRSTRAARSYLIEVDGMVAGERLVLNWTYSEDLHRRETIERLARGFSRALEALVSHCLSPQAGGYTPSDFPLARVAQPVLDQLPPGQVEDLYPLSPLQEGMLFHTLLAPGQYFVQLVLELRGPLDPDALRRAWDGVVARHSALRTWFLHRDVEEPVQVVAARTELAWEVADWRGLEAGEQRERLAAFLTADRARGFDLQAPPLSRLLLLRTSEETHQLVWSLHHLLLDGWSVPIVLREVLVSYEALRRGAAPQMPAPRPFRDYITWLAGRDAAASEAFWRRTLAGLTAPRPLLGGHGRAADRLAEDGYGEQDYVLPAAAAEALRALARRNRLTLSTVLQGAWALLLARASGEEDVVFGATVSGRPADLAAAEEMVGMFINTVPVRVGMSPAGALVPWLQRFQDEQAELRQHEHTPLVQVQGWSAVPRDLPLFETLLVIENYPLDPGELAAGSSLQIGAVRSFERTNYPLTVFVDPGTGLRFHAVYRSGHFEGAAVARLLGRLGTLLQALPDPTATYDRLPLMEEAERQQILVEWSDTRAPYPSAACVHELFLERARQAADAVALVCDSERLTYGELARRVEVLAERLARLGVGPEVAVGLCVERGPALVVGMLGVLLAGGSYLPLDPTHPESRLAYALQDSGAAVLLTDGSTAGRFAAFTGAVVRLDEPWVRPEGAAPRAGRPGPDNAAYAIYTSGSTGKPKGVVVTHRGVTNFLATMAASTGIGAADVLAGVTTISFDIAVLEILLPLTTGGRVALLRGEALRDGRCLAAAIATHGATALQATPATWRLLADAGWEGKADLKILCGGEALPPDLAEFLLPRGAGLWNLYGPTETTVWSTVERVAPGRSVSVGRPLGNTRIAIVERGGGPAPIGVPGELCIGGTGVARGYLGRPDLTAEKFVPDPWGEPGGRLYRTGDLARLAPDGRIDFLGRTDHQVKVRGFRIELQEIEAALEMHPRVREAAAAVWRQPGAETVLVAYVVAAPGDLQTTELRRFLAERLPPYMVPSQVVFLDALPRTLNRKLDRAALPEPRWSEPVGPAEGMEPQTPVERLLAGLWSEVLGVASVRRHDGFFDLGGHSLLAGRILARVREVFRVDVPLRAVFERPFLAGWAEAIEAALRGGAAFDGAIPRAERQGSVPASSAQQRLWFIDRFEPESPVYNIPLAIQLEGDPRPAVLRAALAGVIARHESLRTTFAEQDGQVVQVCWPSMDVRLPEVDLAALDGTAAELESRRLAAQEAERPFDLARGPLLRPVLLRQGERRYTLLLTLHHIVADGWSVIILVRELAHLYEALLAGEPPSLLQPDLQYADYAVWQRRRLERGELEPELAFWKRRLSGAPAVLELPADRPRPAVQSFSGTRLPLALEEALASGVSTLGRSHRATAFMVLLAAFKALLSRLAGTADVVVGSLVANRTRPETAGVIGVFVNTQVLRTRLDGNPSFREILGRVRETVLEAYAHQDLPFEELVVALAPQRDLSRTPLFQVAFAHQDAPLAETTVSGLIWRPLEVDTQVSRFDFGIDIVESGGVLRGQIEYSTDLFDAATVLRMAGQYRQLLAACAADPETDLAEIPLLSGAERHQLLVEWNDTVLMSAPAGRLHELLSEQAERTPDAVAVIDGESRLTYRDLDAAANRLARYLRRKGVEPGVLVGIALERSPALMTAVLGVLKAGGAYVPLDPAYPSQRLDFMLEDSGVTVLVTAEGVLPSLPERRMEIVRLDVEAPRIAAESAEPLRGLGGGEELAYVIYTSGSTGRPKGVAVPHRGLVNVVDVQRRAFGLGPGQRVLQFSSINFDISVFEILLALGSGSALVLAPHGALAAVAGLAELLRRQQVTAIVLPPSVLATLPADELPSVEMVVVGGEACPADLVLRWAQGRRFWNGYGPTETSIWTTLALCQANGRRPPIGRPIPGMQAYVATAACVPVPVGVPGELLAGGVGLAWGYLGRPGLTAERFVPDPFGGEPGGRLYRTGDLVRELADGTIEFLGRIDHQVKVRGFRIELGEIETVLGEQPGVREVVVVVREDQPGDRRLVAYLVAAHGQELDPDELRLAVKERLPDSMMPSAFVQLDALPLTPSAKVDRLALPAPGAERPVLKETYTAPRHHVEEILARVWSEVLGVRQVGVHDNFFTLGGDSILSLRVVARAGEAGIRLSARQIFEHQTVAELAAVASSGVVVMAEQGPVIGEVPLTPIQSWFFAQGFAVPEHWNQSLLLVTRPGTDAGLLEQVLNHLVLHHDALRLRFQRGATGWSQHSVGYEPLGLLQCDLSRIPSDQRSDAIAQVASCLHASLDLTAGPLVRACHFACGPEPGRLLLIAHHLVVDGVSWRILLSDLAAGYAQLRRADVLRLPPKTTSFRQWALLLAERAQEEELAEELVFWRGEAALLPPDSPAVPPGTEAAALRRSAALTTDETDLLLREAPVAYDATVLELLLAAWARASRSMTGSRVLVVDLEGHGRESLPSQADLSRTVGWFTTVFPFVLDADDGEARTVVAAARRLRSMPHHGIGFGLLRHLAPDPGVRDELRRLERAQASFNYLGQVDEAFPEDSPFGLALEPSGPDRAPGGQRVHAIEVLCAVASGRLQIEVAASVGHDAQGFLEAFLKAIRWLIDSRLDEPSVPVSEYLPELGFEAEEIDVLIAKYGAP